MGAEEEDAGASGMGEEGRGRTAGQEGEGIDGEGFEHKQELMRYAVFTWVSRGTGVSFSGQPERFLGLFATLGPGPLPSFIQGSRLLSRSLEQG